jgi:hypothetical protein
MGECQVDSTGLEQGSCECGNEPSGLVPHSYLLRILAMQISKSILAHTFTIIPDAVAVFWKEMHLPDAMHSKNCNESDLQLVFLYMPSGQHSWSQVHYDNSQTYVSFHVSEHPAPSLYSWLHSDTPPPGNYDNRILITIRSLIWQKINKRV